MRSESAGLEQGSGDVVGQVAEAQGRAAQVLQASVDRLCGAIAGARPLEVGQHVGGASLQGPTELAQLVQPGGDVLADGVDERLHRRAAEGSVLLAVGRDHPLVDPYIFHANVDFKRQFVVALLN